MTDVLQVVEKRSLPAQVGYLFALHDTHSLVGYPVCYVGIVVHAVSHQLALRRQRKVLNKLACRHYPLLQTAVLPDLKRVLPDGWRLPAIRRVSFIYVYQEEVCHIGKLLHQPPECRQVADKGGSGG